MSVAHTPAIGDLGRGAHDRRLESSRRALLDAIGDSRDLTFVRGYGNRGDELIWAGARRLLAGRIGREISIDELGASEGELAMITGGGALCRSYCEVMPDVIAVAELRFERVIVLPSSIEVEEDRVRDVLARSAATVFARERESLRAIAELCDARLAHDTAFFFDYGPWADEAGCGRLDAFRLDRERSADVERPPGNDDISTTCASLDAWLARIAAATHVRTDRAHVMIAAALLGKSVEYAPSNYHKLPAIARWSLPEFPVSPLPAPGRAREPWRPSPRRRRLRASRYSASSVCAVIATRDRPETATAAADSVLEVDGASAIVVDSNSAPGRRLTKEAGDARLRIRTLDHDLGRGGCRALAVGMAAAELILLLDDDLVLEPGALETMARELRADPGLAALTASVAGPDGALEHRGGTYAREGDLVRMRRTGGGSAAASRLGLAPCDWAPHSALLVRAEVLESLPVAVDVPGFEDEEWALRALRASLRVGCATDAFATRGRAATVAYGVPFAARMRALELASSLATVHRRHGVVLDVVFELLPELAGDLDAARIVFDLLQARGRHAVFAAWDAGELAPLLRPRR